MQNYTVTNLSKIEFEEIEDVYNFLKFIVDREKLNDSYFDIIFVDDNKIKQINNEYRGKNVVTDVISFALMDDYDINIFPRPLGDIYISIERAFFQASEYNHSKKRELLFLITHGILHLLGYDHINLKDEKIMFDKQKEILYEYGIKR